ncbi:hypothetical protein F5Y03DRAFT_356576 [Xylaria venustula]|nr:hypothetical protein F5Y03DRAFT_356576 [Xylaria venustula]
MPCSRCFDRLLTCKMSEGVSRCMECVRAGCSCDGLGVPINTVNNIVSEHRRLEDEEKQAEQRLLLVQDELKRAQDSLQFVLGELARLRAQKQFLKTKGIRMV